MLSDDTIDLFKNWQTLIGSAIGIFFAAIIPLLGFYFRKKYQQRHERKESLRRIEIATTMTLNTLYTTVQQLEAFVQRVKDIISILENEKDENAVLLIETNYPPTIDIYYDEELPMLPLKSYYLHNKIIIIDYLIRWANSSIKQFREDLAIIVKKSELLMSNKVPPQVQRISYLTTLKSYIGEVEKFINSLNIDNSRTIVEAKVYNQILRKKYIRTLWKHERHHFKIYRDKAEMKKQSRKFEQLENIDNVIKEKVEQFIKETENKDGEKAI